jgi:hypothetical protein
MGGRRLRVRCSTSLALVSALLLAGCAGTSENSASSSASAAPQASPPAGSGTSASSSTGSGASASSSSSSGTGGSKASGSPQDASSFRTTFAVPSKKVRRLGQVVGIVIFAAQHQGRPVLVSSQGLAARATTLASSLGHLNAPAQYKSELAALQSDLTQLATALHSISTAAAAHDAGAAKSAATALADAAQRVKNGDQVLSAKLGLSTGR